MDKKEYQKQYRLKNKEKAQKYECEYRKNHREECNKRHSLWRAKNRGSAGLANQANIRAKRKRRIKILVNYGGNPPKCSCCKESNLEFLALDHINGGGTKERIKNKIDPDKLARLLIKNNYPEGYRVLCHNCNQSLGLFGYCPHSKTEQELELIRQNKYDIKTLLIYKILLILKEKINVTQSNTLTCA